MPPALKRVPDHQIQMHREDILAKLRERIVAYAASRLSRDMADDLAPGSHDRPAREVSESGRNLRNSSR